MAAPHVENKADVRLLDARTVKFGLDPFSRLTLEVGIEERYDPVRAVRCLPLTDRDRFISLQDDEGHEIGILETLEGMDRESRRRLEDELDLVYLHPHVTAIHGVETGKGIITWKFSTTIGDREVYVKDRNDIRPLPDGRIVVTDVHGTKYEIPGFDKLDERSRRWLEIEL